MVSSSPAAKKKPPSQRQPQREQATKRQADSAEEVEAHAEDFDDEESEENEEFSEGEGRKMDGNIGVPGDDEAGPGSEAENATFASLGLADPLVQACASLGWKAPSAIQCEAIPHALNGNDLIALAETGSGKTAAFALPVLHSLLAKPQALFALVVSPTRELALQIGGQFEALGAGIGVKCAVVVGGVDMMAQSILLAKRPHVIVGTPGRLVDHLENTKGFSVRAVKFVVLDEADKLLNMDFEKELDTILRACPRERNTYLFSATMTSKVKKLQRASLTNPVKVEVSSKYATVRTLVQQYLFMPAKHKDCYFTYVCNELAGLTAIVFVATCASAQRLALMLRALGFSAVPLHGQLSQAKRLAALNKFKAGERSILIATDVASRGLDIPSVDLVVNYELPANSKDYIHRVGRTARAGRAGRAVTLVTQYDVELYQRIEHMIEQKLEEFKAPQGEVMLLLERVGEAQRYAAMEMRSKEHKGKGGRGGGGGGRGGERSAEAEAEPDLHRMMDQASRKKRKR